MMRIKINRRIVSYVLCGILIMAALLYLRFPSEAVTQYLVSVVSEHQPDTILLIDAVKPTIPPGLSFENIQMGFRDLPEASIHADKLKVRPDYWNFLKGKSSLVIGADMYEGSLKGSVDVAGFIPARGPVHAKMNIQDISIQKFHFITKRIGRQISGKLTGFLTYNGELNNVLTGSGSMEFTLLSGSYPLLENLFGFDKLDFDKVEAAMDLKNGVLKVSKLKLTGEKVRCLLKGDILLKPDVRNSQLEMTCSIEFPGQSNKKVTLAITGTLGNPATKLM
jgi:type II secretion system protein N